MRNFLNLIKKRKLAMILIIGLGNPGEKYRGTRHNCGFMTIDRLAEKYEIKLDQTSEKAIHGKGRICGKDVILAKPQTYMNESGISVKMLMSRFHVPAEDILVIYDDMDTDVGSIRMRLNGSAGSHNGMKSIIEHIKTESFKRLRVGIGKPERIGTIDFVLGDFKNDEVPLVNEAIDNAVEAVTLTLARGAEFAMNKFNKKKKPEAKPAE